MNIKIFPIKCLFIFTILWSQSIKSQNTNTSASQAGSVSWASAPFDHQLFITNNSQFDTMVNGKNKVLFGTLLGNVWAYFTNNGIIYRYDEYPKKSSALASAAYDPDMDEPVKPIVHFVNVTWEGSNKNTLIESSQQQAYYYTYPKGKNGSIKATIFKKIVYKNLYPNIDVEYAFPSGKDGIEYSLVLHPGANISNVKIHYDGIKEIHAEANGDIKITSLIDEFTEHAPVSYYNAASTTIEVASNISDHTETFQIQGEYDRSKTIVVDPWISNPLFNATYNKAYDVDYDNNGNVYAYGSWSPFQLVKFNSAGVKQWAYNAITFNEKYYGDFAVDKKTGTCYIVEGFAIPPTGAKAQKINTNGSLLATFPGTIHLDEMWRAAYNPLSEEIVIGAGGTHDSNQTCILDTNLVSITPVNYLGAAEAYHDVALLAIDPSGLTAYMGTTHSGLDNLFNDVVAQLPLPSLFPPTYLKPDNFNFQEGYAAKYVDSGGSVSNVNAGGYNGMAASYNWLYVYDGNSLKKMNKSTGAIIDSAAISTGTVYWGGLDVDSCDDIYLGSHDSIKYYNSSFVFQRSVIMSGNVYDIVIGKNNILYTCGNGFVAAITPPDSLCGHPLAIENINNSQGINIFPNPNPGTFTIQVNNKNADKLYFKITNILGQTIYEENAGSPKGFYSQTINIGSEANGMYFISFTLGNNMITKKIIIEK